MMQINVTKKNTGIAKKLLSCVITGCMIFNYCENLCIPIVYAANTTNTCTDEEIITVSPATPKSVNTMTDTYTDQQGITYTLNSDQTCKVSGYTKDLKPEIVIPEKIIINNTSYSVQSIEKKAFSSCKSLISVTIPKSVTTISSHAFYRCDNLTSLNISEGVTTIERYAFYHCDGLTSVTLPSTLTSIGEKAFECCINLTAFNVNENNRIYMSLNGVLYSKNGETLLLCPAGTKELTAIPSSVTTIAASAFDECYKLTKVTLPSSVTKIGSYAFDNCKSLSTINIPASVKNIEHHSFDSCSSLTNITIPEGVISIDYCAFNNCVSLTKIYLPSSITHLGSYLFQDCRSLTSATIKSNVTSIGYGTFDKCINLTNIILPDTLTTIYDNEFTMCIRLTNITIPKNVTHIGNAAFAGCISLTSITLPENVTSIGHYAFEVCPNLKSIFLSKKVTDIGQSAFLCCDKLIIYGDAGSVAETYAKDNGLPFSTTYKITYNLNGGTNNTKNPSIYTTQTTVKLASPQRAGYTFKGWYKTANFKSNSKVTTISKSSKGNITLYAKWAEVKKPAKAALKTVKSKKSGTLTITAKKIKSVAGYEYTVATDKKFTKNVKTVTSKKLTTTIKGLKKGKTYYVKVRAYKLDSTNRKLYGKYSSAKKVKIKK